MTKQSIKQQIKNLLIMLACLGMAAAVCAAFIQLSHEDAYAGIIFVLSIAFTARFTKGYFWGIAASLIGAILVNWAFTEPYLVFDSSVSQYPLTFMVLLCVAILVSMLTTRTIKVTELRAAAEYEKLRADLLRSVSHDVRTPLTSIAGSAATFLENREKLPEQTKIKLISDIQKEAEWLIRVFENILTITRVDSGQQQLTKRPEAAEEVIAEVIISFRHQHPDIPVITTVPSELVMVPMDALLIERVMQNLMENAVIHGGDVTEIDITLRTEKNFAVFTFSDDGDGISPDILDHLFDGLFVRKEKTATDGRKNMGIGLSLCRSIITLHRGELRGRNTEKGAEFEFTLPLDSGVKQTRGRDHGNKEQGSYN